MLKLLFRCVSSLKFFKGITLLMVLFFGLGQHQDANGHDIIEQTKDLFAKEIKDFLKFNFWGKGFDHVGSITFGGFHPHQHLCS